MSAGAAGDRAPRVLLVDDEEDILLSIRFLLEQRLGAEVTALSSPQEALERLDPTYDLVLTDQRMPVMHGVELIRKANEKCPEVPCVLFTAYQDQDLVQAAISAGAKSVLNKVLMPAELVQHVELIIRPQAGRSRP